MTGVILMVLPAAVLIAALRLVHRRMSEPADEVSVPALTGAPPSEHAVSRFHVRWYAVSLVFLAFDVEMLFMYPWVLVVVEMGREAIVEMFIFLGLLMVGVVYAWRQKAFKWA